MFAQPPLFSIVTTTYQRATFVTQAIESVLHQTFSNWELIIVDDGSTDNTRAIVEPYLSDSRIEYFNVLHAGNVKAKNFGLSKISGAFVGYLDSDNLYDSEFLYEIKKAIDEDANVEFFYGNLISAEHDVQIKNGAINREFNRHDLLQGNYIDQSVVIHAAHLIQQHGVFDESLTRLVDWDLFLRYTQRAKVRYVNVPAVYYRKVDEIRITDLEFLGPNRIKVLQKWPPASRPIKVLYALWQYPHICETYIETELQLMHRYGCEIYIWRSSDSNSSYPSSFKVFDGEFCEAVANIKPDLIHVHWIGFLRGIEPLLDSLHIPVTLRLHGFDFDPTYLTYILEKSWLKSVYAFPHHVAVPHAKLKVVNVAFDTKLYSPSFIHKNKKLVARVGACLPSKDIFFFLDLAKVMPNFEFVMALVRCTGMEHYVEEVIAYAEKIGSPAKIYINLSREEAAKIVQDAGIYLHTTAPIGDPYFYPVGMPISIAEAMATGSYVIARKLEEIEHYVGDAGKFYDSIASAAALINETLEWTDATWLSKQKISVERAYAHHADEVVLREIYTDWTDVFKFAKNLWLENHANLIEEFSQRDEVINRLECTINAILSSKSWRLTKPLRFVSRQLGKLKYLVKSIISKNT